MTTIATDGKTMAADGRSCCHNTITSSTTVKLAVLPDGRIAGCCGDSELRVRFFAWLREGGESPKLNDTFGALVLSPCGKVEFYGEHCCPVEFDPPYAIGSGMDFALAAMDCGKSPFEAVQIAAKRDTGTGGTITVQPIGGE